LNPKPGILSLDRNECKKPWPGRGAAGSGSAGYRRMREESEIRQKDGGENRSQIGARGKFTEFRGGGIIAYSGKFGLWARPGRKIT
jgi:hypothetical protein